MTLPRALEIWDELLLITALPSALPTSNCQIHGTTALSTPASIFRKVVPLRKMLMAKEQMGANFVEPPLETLYWTELDGPNDVADAIANANGCYDKYGAHHENLRL